MDNQMLCGYHHAIDKMVRVEGLVQSNMVGLTARLLLQSRIKRVSLHAEALAHLLNCH
jgi:hypothetical protein